MKSLRQAPDAMPPTKASLQRNAYIPKVPLILHSYYFFMFLIVCSSLLLWLHWLFFLQFRYWRVPDFTLSYECDMPQLRWILLLFVQQRFFRRRKKLPWYVYTKSINPISRSPISITCLSQHRQAKWDFSFFSRSRYIDDRVNMNFGWPHQPSWDKITRF